jgi:hypothetical protein
MRTVYVISTLAPVFPAGTVSVRVSAEPDTATLGERSST